MSSSAGAISGQTYTLHVPSIQAYGFAYYSGYLYVYGVGNSISFVSPTTNATTTDNFIDFNLSATILGSGSYHSRIIYTKYVDGSPRESGFRDDAGLSIANGGTFNFYPKMENLDSGTYKNFRAQLIQYSNGNIVAEATSSVQITVVASSPTGSFEGTTYYTGSSTAFYSEYIPSILADNGLATPTAFYTDITGFIDNILNNIYGFAGGFSQFFSQTNAIQWGQNIQTALTTVFGYINAFDSFGGGYPWGASIIFFVILSIAMLVIKAIKVTFLR